MDLNSLDINENGTISNISITDRSATITFNAVKSVHACGIIILNSLLLFALWKFNCLRHLPDYFSLHLGIADLFVGLQSFFDCVCYFTAAFKYFAIYIVDYFLFKVGVYVSLFTFSAFSIKQFQAIRDPLHANLVAINLRILIVIVWLCSVVLSCAGTYLKQRDNDTPQYKIFKHVELGIFLLCCLVIIASYGGILILMKFRADKIRPTISGQTNKIKNKTFRMRKALVIGFIVTALYIISFIPYVIFYVISNFKIPFIPKLYLSGILLTLRSLVDPCIQFWRYSLHLLIRKGQKQHISSLNSGFKLKGIQTKANIAA